MKYIVNERMTDTFPSLPVWGAWIEIPLRRWSAYAIPSLPVWGAWIEICNFLMMSNLKEVAPRVGGVD